MKPAYTELVAEIGKPILTKQGVAAMLVAAVSIISQCNARSLAARIKEK